MGGAAIANVEMPRSEAELLRRGTVVNGNRHLLQENTQSTGKVVIAEGGAQYLYPEMTARAYEEAMDNGADFVVCKVAVTQDFKAVCHPHPQFDLSDRTDVKQKAKFANRGFKFELLNGIFTFNLTLAEIRTLRVIQTKPGRTRAFDNSLGMATPEDIIAMINRRAATYPSAKPVGIALEISEYNKEIGFLDERLSPLKYAIDLLTKNNWTALSSPAMIITQRRLDLNDFGGVQVRRLYRAPDKDMPLTLTQIATSSTGVMFHITSLLNQKEELFWGKPIPKMVWNIPKLEEAKKYNLSVFAWGFNESDWSSKGANFNTFLADPMAVYLPLLSGNLSSLVAGVATDWPATAAKAAACYKERVPLFPAKGLAKDRPLTIASGGSVGLLPAHTKLAQLQAIREGADFIACSLQVSKDGVLFCLESLELVKYTNVNKLESFQGNRTNPNISGEKMSWWSFDILWKDLTTLRVVPKTRNNDLIDESSARPDTFYNQLPILRFDEFIDIAQNETRTVGILIKIDNPTYLLRLDPPIDQISLMLGVLQKGGYLGANYTYARDVDRPLLIASQDICGMETMYSKGNGTLPLLYRIGSVDECESVNKPKNERKKPEWWVSNEGMTSIRKYGEGISPRKPAFFEIHNAEQGLLSGFTNEKGATPLASTARAQDLSIYPRVFRNDVAPGDEEGAYDFLGDPAVELAYYIDQLNVAAIEVQFVETAVNYLASSCRPSLKTPLWPGFNVTVLHPGAIAEGIDVLRKESKGDAKLSGGALAGIIVSSLIFIFAAVATTVYLLKKRYGKEKPERLVTFSFGSFRKMSAVTNFTQADLQAATNNFNEENRLGKGGFGTVYKGVLADGKAVAVKKLNVVLTSKEDFQKANAVQQLLNEIDIIGTVHNRNVVQLEGACMTNELLLVYDYMPNGSLEDALFNPTYGTELEWKQWYNIAVGTAKGLAYLHEECEHKIIHRDIKPANILLDSQLNPRVADFGLARNVRVEDTHVTTKVMGSFGYMAPDYATTGQLTERSDVYSFGMLLLTIITGRQPINFESRNSQTAKGTGDSDSSNSQNVPAPSKWSGASNTTSSQNFPTLTLELVKKKAQKGTEELLTVVNSKFAGKYDHDEAVRWLYTALLCTQTDPDLRPTMGDVVQMLMGKMEVPDICIAPAELIFPRKSSKSSFSSSFSTSFSMTRSMGASGSQDLEQRITLRDADANAILEGDE